MEVVIDQAMRDVSDDNKVIVLIITHQVMNELMVKQAKVRIMPIELAAKSLVAKVDGASRRELYLAVPRWELILPGCFLHVKAIGVMRMIDLGEKDDKIIAVSGKSIGIIGLGKINSAIAKRMEAFGCPIRSKVLSQVDLQEKTLEILDFFVEKQEFIGEPVLSHRFS
nr:soluble inorganic pyrophosphatase 1 [Tanacetum cinerariifolium]